MIWRCPNCYDALTDAGGRWCCSAGHSFDLAKQGYANLLLPNQKRSKVPGDSRAMVLSRRRFLESGHYAPLVDAMAAMLEAPLQESSAKADRVTLLDLGCGEGYYVNALAQCVDASSWSKCDVYGLDISREAVKLAASALPRGHLCVASTFRAPVADQSVDVALQVFAPVAVTEVNRLLKPAGVWLRVSPGARHLHQLKDVLYSRAREHTPPALPAGFRLIAERQLGFELQLQEPQAVSDLLTMTPLAWHGSAEAREQLINEGSLRTDADFVLQLMAVSGDAAESSS